MDPEGEQRVNIKFCVELGKTSTETFELLQKAYGDQALPRDIVFELHKKFIENRVPVNDDPKTRRPSTAPSSDTKDNPETFDKVTRVAHIKKKKGRENRDCQ